jgi:hypothetical protein
VTGAGIRGQVVSMSVSTENTIPPVFLKVNFVVSSFSATLFQNDGVLGNIVSKVGAKCLKSLNSYMVLMDEKK